MILGKLRNSPIRVDVVEVNGPDSYTAGGFDVTVPSLSTVKAAVVLASGGYVAEVAGVAGNKVKVKVLYFDYDAAADGTAIEVPAGTNLAGVKFTVIAFGF